MFLGLPLIAAAELSASGIPPTSSWYFHADFETMRGSDAGRHLYGWLRREVFEELREEAGIDLDKEADTITAFSAEDSGAVVLIDGNISQQSKDKLLAMAAAAKSLETLKHGSSTFYFADGERHARRARNVEIDSFENGIYFTFALEDRILATSRRKQMEALLDGNGRLPARETGDRTLIVMTAEKEPDSGGHAGGENRGAPWRWLEIEHSAQRGAGRRRDCRCRRQDRSAGQLVPGMCTLTTWVPNSS